MTEQVEIAGADRPRADVGVGRRVWERETAADLPARSRGAVVVEEPLPQRRRTPGPVHVYPDRDRFRDGGPVDGQDRTALGPTAAGPAAERRELHVVPVTRRATQHERGAPQHPRAVDSALGDVVDVVGSDVLEVARDRVEPQPIDAIDIPEADPASCHEPSPLLAGREELVLHRAPRVPKNPRRHSRTRGDIWSPSARIVAAAIADGGGGGHGR